MLSSSFLSSFVEFRSTVSEEKSKMSRPIRGKGSHLVFSDRPKKHKLLEDTSSLAKVPIHFPPTPLGGFSQVFKLSANMRLTSSASYMLVLGSLVMYQFAWIYQRAQVGHMTWIYCCYVNNIDQYSIYVDCCDEQFTGELFHAWVVYVVKFGRNLNHSRALTRAVKSLSLIPPPQCRIPNMKQSVYWGSTPPNRSNESLPEKEPDSHPDLGVVDAVSLLKTVLDTQFATLSKQLLNEQKSSAQNL